MGWIPPWAKACRGDERHGRGEVRRGYVGKNELRDAVRIIQEAQVKSLVQKNMFRIGYVSYMRDCVYACVCARACV